MDAAFDREALLHAFDERLAKRPVQRRRGL